MKRLTSWIVPTLMLLQIGCVQVFYQDAILDLIGPTVIVASAGPDSIVNSGQAVVLDASGSFLQTGSGSTVGAIEAGFSFSWEVVDAPAGAAAPTLLNADASQCTFSATTAGAYSVQVTVTDGVRQGRATVTIVID